MLPFQDENMKKAAERLLEYSGTLSATFDLLRSDLLVTAVWYCLKEEQQNCKRLKDILSKQTASSNTVTTIPKVTASPKDVGKGLKEDSTCRQKSVSVAEKKTTPPISTMPKTINNKPVPKSKIDKIPVNNNKGRRNSSDSDVCIIEIDDTDDVDKTDSEKSKEKGETGTNNTPKETAKKPLKPANKTVETSEIVTRTETQTIAATDIDDLFDMDCDEIVEEQEHINKSESETKLDKTVYASDTTEHDQEITIISDDEVANKPKEGESESTKEAKSKKKKKGSTRKDSKEKSAEEKGEVNVIEDDEASQKLNSAAHTDKKLQSQCDNKEKEKSNKDSNETPPFPTALTANVADKTISKTPVETITLSYSDVLSQGENIGLTNTQHSNSLSSFNQNLSSEVVHMTSDVNTLHQPALSQSNIAANNTLPVNDPGTLNMAQTFLCPVANEMDNVLNDQQQYFVQPQIVNTTLADVKTESVVQPPGYMFEDPRQVESNQDPLFASQPYLPMNSEPVSLSSLSSGALTYPYSSTTEIVPGLHGSRGSGALSEAYQTGYFDPRVQQQNSQHISPDQDIRLKSRKRGSSMDTVSPPNKRRLLDFDRKWHEGPSGSKGQERYIAPPSNAMKMVQPYWNDSHSEARRSDTEWAMWFQSYKSMSDNIQPPFLGGDMTQTIVQTETVGESLDDIGAHDSQESDASLEEKKKSARGSRGGGRWLRRRGQRGRGLARGRPSSSRGRGSSVSRGRGSSATRGRGRSPRGTGASGARGRPVSASEGSPQKSGTFSFYKRGRVGYSRTRTRSGRGKGFSGAASIAEAVKTSDRHQAAASNTGTSKPKRGTRGVRGSRSGRTRGRGRGRRGQVQT